MARGKSHVLPDTKRVTIVLEKERLKTLKKIGLDIEMSDEEVLDLEKKNLIELYKSQPQVEKTDDLRPEPVRTFIKLIENFGKVKELPEEKFKDLIKDI